MKTKVCRVCKQRKSFDRFHKRKTSKDGFYSQCKKCATEYHNHKKYWLQPKAKEKQKRLVKTLKYKKMMRRGHLRRAYKLTLEQHKQIYIQQNGCCAICGKPIPYDKVHTDHNHLTGKVRELLCRYCNLGLAYIEDIEFLDSSVKYLEKHNAPSF